MRRDLAWFLADGTSTVLSVQLRRSRSRKAAAFDRRLASIAKLAGYGKDINEQHRHIYAVDSDYAHCRHVTMVAGLILVVAGAATWFTVQSNLADERITVSADSPRFAGDSVDGPLTAFQEAEMIERHYLETNGKTYAELDREDLLRQTAMTASFLRASLFTSVGAFGVAALAVGLGIVLIVAGYGLMSLAGAVPNRG